MTIRFLSVCSGLEGASLATGSLGWSPVGFAEIETFPSAIIAERFGSNMPNEPFSCNAPPNFGDFTEIDISTLGNVEVLIGGTPCQAFSIAGKRLSLADARGNLTLSYAVLAHELAQSNGLRNAFWENVPGSLSTPDNAFGCFLGALVGFGDALVPCARPARGRSNAGWSWKLARREFVLDDDGAETGEFVDRPAEHVARWPSSGMASGPRARLAWRVLDAQYFGLAQRRERVFLIADFGNGADPAEVLLEPQSLRGNSAPSRETREGVAGTLSARTQGGGGLGTDFDIDGGLVAAFGGGNRSGAVERAATLTAKGQRSDFEVETFVACQLADSLTVGANQTTGFVGDDIAHTLRGNGFDASEDGTGRGTPIVPVAFRTSGNCGAWETGDRTDALTTGTDPNSHILAFTSKDYGWDATSDLSPTLRAMGHGETWANGGGQLAVAFAIQERAVSENPNAGPQGMGVQEGVAYTLEARHHVQAVAFAQNTRDEVRLLNGDGSISGALGAEPGMKQQTYVAQALDLPGREGGAQFEGPHDTANIRAVSSGASRPHVAERWAVRRLTPTECERLQGVPDDYTAIPWRGKPVEECPDGPRYKALGNSWAVPVVHWIAARLTSVLNRLDAT